MKKIFYILSISFFVISQEQNIFYKDADVKTFAQDIALLTDKTVILDPRVKGTISVYSESSLNKESIWEVFVSTMEVQGYSVLKDGDIFKIIPAQEGIKNFNENNELPGSIDTQIVTVNYSSAKDIVNAVKPLVGVRSYIVALNNDREILVSDDLENVIRVVEIIKNLDSELDTVISDLKLENLSSIEALRIINSLKSDPNNKLDKLGVATFQGSNKLIFSGPSNIINKVIEMLQKIDIDNRLEENTKVIYLNYSKAEDILKILNDVSGSFNQEQNLDYKTVITAHDETNSIIIRSSPQSIRTLTSIVSQLDIRRPQVLVEAIIVEISESIARSLGVDTIYSGDSEGDKPIALTRFPNSKSPDLLSLLGAADSDSDSVTNFNATSSLLNTSGLVAGLGNTLNGEDNFAVLLSLLREDQDSNILSTPSVVALDNEEASLLVGQEIPITTGESLGSNNLRQEVSSIAGSQLPNSTDLITNKREIESTILADDREIIVLGGLINEDVQESVNKVPLLGDIPIVGGLFRSSAKSVQKRNLMVFLRPTILRDSVTTKDLSQEKFNLIRAKQIFQESLLEN